MNTNICPLAWSHPHIYNHDGITVYPCCPGDNNTAFGKLDDTHSFEEVWNSDIANKFRAKMYARDYTGCNLSQCGTRGRYISAFDFWDYSGIKTEGGGGIIVKFCHDFECNLHCTTCRDSVRINSKGDLQLLNDKIGTVFLPMIRNVDAVYFAGDGDPFFSRHYRAMIKAINQTYPNMPFLLHTNAQLCNEKNCTELGITDKIYSVLISINASCKETYERIMRGAKWEKLLENLNWLKSMRDSKKIKNIFFSFVIQKDNYREMPDFVRLGEQYGAAVRFTRYQNWGTELHYDESAIFEQHNPEFKNYLKMLCSPVFSHKGCYLDPISEQLRLNQMLDVDGLEF